MGNVLTAQTLPVPYRTTGHGWNEAASMILSSEASSPTEPLLRMSCSSENRLDSPRFTQVNHGIHVIGTTARI